MNSETKICQNCKQEFVIEPDDFAYYERLDLPLPDKCVYCRWKHLLSFWVFGKFRIAKSALSGKSIITVFPESVKFPLYDHKEWVSDAWDPFSYGQEYDSKRSFFEQFGELQSAVPHPHQLGIKNVNCDWTDDTWESREAYLTRSALLIEFVSYGYRIIRCKNSVDITYCFDTENSYNCLYCFKSYNLRHSFNCRDCINGAFLYDCRNCQNCFMSWNLRNKRYCILNQQYSKEDYFKKLEEFDLKSYSAVERLKKDFQKYLSEDAVHRADDNVQTTNSSGNFLAEDKNCHSCYFLEKSENCRNCFRGFGSKDCIDMVSPVSEKCAIGCMDQWGYKNICNLYASYCRYSAYLDNCEECENCFGCVGLRKKSYCILNKQYTKEEYERFVADIKNDMKKRGEWGNFFPLSAAYTGYNYSLANIMFPFSKDEALRFGAKWDETHDVYHEGVSGNDLPDRIDEVKDDIIKQRIICPETKLSYNISPSELSFYREHGIPLPRHHFDWRTLNRFRPFTYMVKPQKGVCCYCKKEIEHYYGPELGYKKIACVECYQKEVA
ncbi:MAG: hypothetical protein Q8Q17_03325 [bacterium]|nr:hypothetical protein [bacterium]